MELTEHRRQVERFLDSGAVKNTLGLVYGRRRIGKSTLLEGITVDRGGFYWEATRTESAIQLARLGEALGAYLGVGRLALDTWEQGLNQLLRLGEGGPVPIVLDEFGTLMEADPSIDSIVASALGPAARRSSPGQSRLILCGSAVAMLGALTAGEAPLRGRAGMELIMQPLGYREAAELLPGAAGPERDLELATRVYGAIGGAIGYATDMVDHDLPAKIDDFDRWIAARILSPAATLHHEATTLLAEDPTLAPASPIIYHSILGAIANGSVTAGRIANRLRRSVSNLDPALRRLISAGFVIRHADPIRAQRPTYMLADPFLQFHYAILEPHAPLLRDRDPREVWQDRLSSVFDARVRGPVFEEQARTWVRRHVDRSTLGGPADYVGPSTVVIGGQEHQLDVVVSTAPEMTAAPSERTVVAIGEAKAGETIGRGHLRALQQVRAGLGTRAADAKLLLFVRAFTTELAREAAGRADIELVALDRLYGGS